MALTKAERIEAKILAEGMLAKRFSERQVTRALNEKYAMTATAAKRIIKAVFADWEAEEDDLRKRRRVHQLRTLDDLYRKAYSAKKYNVCLQVERLRSRIEGTQEPERQIVGVVGADSDLDDRSLEELEHFVEHGCWPEEQQTVH